MTTSTITKQITFDQVMKLFKKFVAKSDTRPVLQYVYFNGSHLVATDSHQLLRIDAAYISDMPTDKETFLYDPKKSQFIDKQMNYPQTDRIIPDSSWTNSTIYLNSNIKDLEKTVKEVKKHVGGRKNQVMKLEATHHITTISGKRYEEKEDASGVPTMTEETYSNTLHNVFVTGDEITIHCNASYFLNMLDVVKKLSKLTNDPIEMNMVSHLRPIHITNKVFDCLVFPVRTF